MRMLTESLVVGESTRGLVGAAETAAPPKLLRIPWIPWENRQQKSEFCGRHHIRVRLITGLFPMDIAPYARASELPLQRGFPVASGHGVAFHHLVARVAEVVALHGGLHVVAAYAEALVQLKVYGLPRAQQVVAVVGDEREAVARV